MLIKEREKWYERLTAGVWSEFHVWGKESRQALVSALGDCLGGALDLNQACHRQWIHFISSHEKGTGRILRGRGKESLVVMAVFLAKMFIFVLQTFVTPPTLRTSISTELAVWASSRPPPPRAPKVSHRDFIFSVYRVLLDDVLRLVASGGFTYKGILILHVLSRFAWHWQLIHSFTGK